MTVAVKFTVLAFIFVAAHTHTHSRALVAFEVLNNTKPNKQTVSLKSYGSKTQTWICLVVVRPVTGGLGVLPGH